MLQVKVFQAQKLSGSCVLQKSAQNIMKSSRYTKNSLHSIPESARFISFWNVAGALQSPNVMTFNSNNPSCVLEAIFFCHVKVDRRLSSVSLNLASCESSRAILSSQAHQVKPKDSLKAD